MTDEQDEQSGPIDPVAALSQVQDDVEERLAAHQWAIEEMLAGRTPEDLAATLIEQGWMHDVAEEIVESARKDTRSERGVITREDIVRDLNASHRRATNGVSVAFRYGLFGFIKSFIAAMRTADRLKRLAKKK